MHPLPLPLPMAYPEHLELHLVTLHVGAATINSLYKPLHSKLRCSSLSPSRFSEDNVEYVTSLIPGIFCLPLELCATASLLRQAFYMHCTARTSAFTSKNNQVCLTFTSTSSASVQKHPFSFACSPNQVLARLPGSLTVIFTAIPTSSKPLPRLIYILATPPRRSIMPGAPLRRGRSAAIKTPSADSDDGTLYETPSDDSLMHSTDPEEHASNLQAGSRTSFFPILDIVDIHR